MLVFLVIAVIGGGVGGFLLHDKITALVAKIKEKV